MYAVMNCWVAAVFAPLCTPTLSQTNPVASSKYSGPPLGAALCLRLHHLCRSASAYSNAVYGGANDGFHLYLAQAGETYRPDLALLYRFEQMELAGVAFVFEMNGVVAAEARVAKAVFLAMEFSVHSFAAEIRQAVRFDEAADVFDRTGRCDQL